ncbi:MAG TPA: hypothetical protein VGD65_21780 [Chryseosolibacter sp.]
MIRKITTLFFIIAATLTSRGQERAHWAVPDFFVIQHAGSIGFFSAGVGYNVFESKARFSTHFGSVPFNRGGILNVVSAKLFFKPTTLTVWNRVKFNPVDVGVIGSFHYGDDFETRWPEGVHPKGYYWWHPALRVHIGMESSLTYELKKGHAFEAVTGYIEFNTNELYLVSYFQNLRTLTPWDIIKIGAGARVQF